jgi:hypothetical protein
VKGIRLGWLAAVLLGVVFLLQAQQRMQAPSGWYPNRYRGDIFVGDVQAVNQETQEFTLVTKDKNGKEQSFTGKLDAPCDVPSKEKGRKLKVEDIPVQSSMAALYNVDTEKRNGEKVNVNSVFAISFLKFGGQTMSKPVVFHCSTQPFTQYKCFDPERRACVQN